VYPIQINLVPGPGAVPPPATGDVARICSRARDHFPDLEHIRISTGLELIRLTVFLAAESLSGAVAAAREIAQHIVANEDSVRGWRPRGTTAPA
jgi:hypothetical protein